LPLFTKLPRRGLLGNSESHLRQKWPKVCTRFAPTGISSLWQCEIIPSSKRKRRGNITPEQIQQGLTEAGWVLDSSFYEYLIVAHDDHVSILAHRWVWEQDRHVFELSDERTERVLLGACFDTHTLASQAAARRARRSPGRRAAARQPLRVGTTRLSFLGFGSPLVSLNLSVGVKGWIASIHPSSERNCLVNSWMGLDPVFWQGEKRT
jgi:hypothetical protein